MKLLKGRPIADKILENLQKNIKRERLKPALAILLVGKNKESELYINLKRKAARKIGMDFFVFRKSANVSENKILDLISRFNKNKRVTGAIIQLPLPKRLDTQRIIGTLSPEKDVDGFGPRTQFSPVFPQAILEILKSTGVNLKNKKAVIVANSKIFGEVMQGMLAKEKIKAEYILGLNKNKLKAADIIISAVGKPELIKGEMIKKGAIIIDGGITKRGKKVLGDVDFNLVKDKVYYITPVPGGVGPVTIACLLKNVYLAAKKSQ